MSNYHSNNMYQQQSNQRGYMQQPVTRPRYSSNDPLEDMALAMAYVPWQTWQQIYEPCPALQRGTIFKELDKPFLGRGGRNR